MQLFVDCCAGAMPAWLGMLLALCALALPFAALASGQDVHVSTAEDLLYQLQHVPPGPAGSDHLVILDRNISLRTAQVSKHGITVAANVSICGSNRSLVELDLAGLADLFVLQPGVVLTFCNLTLSNLVHASSNGQSWGPQQLSLPIWAVTSARPIVQLRATDIKLILPYDEVLALSHAVKEAAYHPSHQVDGLSPLACLLKDLSDNYLEATCDNLADCCFQRFQGLGVQILNSTLTYNPQFFPLLSNRSDVLHMVVSGAGGSRGIPAWVFIVTTAGLVLLSILVVAAFYYCSTRRRAQQGRDSSKRACSSNSSSHGSMLDPSGQTLPPRTSSSSRPVAGCKSGSKSSGDLGGSSRGMLADVEAGVDYIPLGRGLPLYQAAASGEGAPLGARHQYALICNTPHPHLSSGAPHSQGASAPANLEGVSCTGANSSSRPQQAAPSGSCALMDELQQLVTQFKLEVDDKQLVIHEVLGQGAYGVVYRGTWCNLSVAVKTVTFQDRSSGSKKMQQRALLEAAITSSISHPNVVSTYSYDIQPLNASSQVTSLGSWKVASSQPSLTNDWKLYIVQQYCNAGSLRALLDKRQLWDRARRQPRLGTVVPLVLDIANGMQHLHRKLIIHGDLNPTNVLLHVEPTPGLSSSCWVAAQRSSPVPAAGVGGGCSGSCRFDHQQSCAGAAAAAGAPSGRCSDACSCSSAQVSNSNSNATSGTHCMVAKIADFGLSVKMPQNASHVSGHRVGTPFYVAPEVAQRGKLTPAADVYSFGVMLWEMCHGKTPFKESRSGGYVPRRGFPFVDPRCPTRLALLATACLNRDPGLRPSFTQIVAELQDWQTTSSSSRASWGGYEAQQQQQQQVEAVGRAGPQAGLTLHHQQQRQQAGPPARDQQQAGLQSHAQLQHAGQGTQQLLGERLRRSGLAPQGADSAVRAQPMDLDGAAAGVARGTAAGMAGPVAGTPTPPTAAAATAAAAGVAAAAAAASRSGCSPASNDRVCNSRDCTISSWSTPELLLQQQDGLGGPKGGGGGSPGALCGDGLWQLPPPKGSGTASAGAAAPTAPAEAPTAAAAARPASGCKDSGCSPGAGPSRPVLHSSSSGDDTQQHLHRDSRTHALAAQLLVGWAAPPPPPAVFTPQGGDVELRLIGATPEGRSPGSGSLASSSDEEGYSSVSIIDSMGQRMVTLTSSFDSEGDDSSTGCEEEELEAGAGRV